MRTTKTRHQFYLPDAMSVKLDQLAAKPGTSKTAILSDALTAWLDRQGAAEVETRFGPRFDRLSRAQDQTDQKVDVLMETLGLFVQHQLTLTAHQPSFDHGTRQLGLERYRQFIELVGRRVAKAGAETPKAIEKAKS